MSPADAPALLARLCATIDGHRWADLADLLDEDFECRYAHTGETFGRDAWIRLNAEYPGFDRMTVADLVGTGDRAAARCHVTGHDDSGPQHFEVATFVVAADGRITAMTEVWTDVAQVAPPGARPD